MDKHAQGLIAHSKLFKMNSKPASIQEIVSLFSDLFASSHPLALLSQAFLIIFFIIPIVLGCLILLIEGRPKPLTKEKKKDE
jgi:hypothetical protein